MYGMDKIFVTGSMSKIMPERLIWCCNMAEWAKPTTWEAVASARIYRWLALFVDFWISWQIPAKGSHRRLISFVADRPGHDRRYAIDPQKSNASLVGGRLKPSTSRRRPFDGIWKIASGGNPLSTVVTRAKTDRLRRLELARFGQTDLRQIVRSAILPARIVCARTAISAPSSSCRREARAEGVRVRLAVASRLTGEQAQRFRLRLSIVEVKYGNPGQKHIGCWAWIHRLTHGRHIGQPRRKRYWGSILARPLLRQSMPARLEIFGARFGHAAQGGNCCGQAHDVTEELAGRCLHHRVRTPCEPDRSPDLSYIHKKPKRSRRCWCLAMSSSWS